MRGLLAARSRRGRLIVVDAHSVHIDDRRLRAEDRGYAPEVDQRTRARLRRRRADRSSRHPALKQAGLQIVPSPARCLLR